MIDLVAWLRAQLDEDEQVARAAQERTPAPWVGDEDDWDDVADARVIRHIVMWNPARVLAEVEAKRRTLDQWATWLNEEGAAQADYQAWVAGNAGPTAPRRTLPKVLGPGLECPVRLLALPYADRPGFLEEWRP